MQKGNLTQVLATHLPQMAMVESPTARSKLDPPKPRIEPQPRFQQPTIWWKGPEEHVREDQHAIRVHQSVLPHLQYGTRLRQPPPRHVRLLFWWSLDEFKVPRPKARMSVDIALEPDGSLDLLKVQQLWGLESVAIIDPLRWKVFETTDPNHLSALGIHQLSLERHIFVTERPTTQETTIRRFLRLLFLDLYFISFLGLYHLIVHGGYHQKQRVPVPKWYDDMVDVRNSVVHQIRESKRDLDETYECVVYCGTRLSGLGNSQHSAQTNRYAAVTRWLDDFEDGRREFLHKWGTVLLTCVLLCLIWFIDRYLVRLV